MEPSSPTFETPDYLASFISAMTRNLSLVFSAIPEGKPVPGKHIKVEDRPLDLDNTQAPDGGLLVKTHYVSLDPYQRGRMRNVNEKSYAPAYPLNEPISNGSIVTVLKSANDKYREGDVVSIGLVGPTTEYAVIPADFANGGLVSKLQNPFGLDLKLFTGALGMPGLTAYSSFYEIGKPKKGETIFISAASGAVGAMVAQLAKREGLKVIGSVGSDEKLNYIINELGCDAGFNYKKESPGDALKRLAPNGIDIYYENVGGEHLSASIDALNERGRVVVCGMISDYNLPWESKYPIRNLQRVFEKRLTLRGFIVADADMGPKYTEEHQRNVQQWIKEGSLKTSMHVTKGMENAPEGLLAIFEGKNFGKSVLEVSAA